MARQPQIEQWANRYGSPLYVYDLDETTRACAALRENLPAGSAIYYSVKANPHPAIAAHLVNNGCRLEISSTGELQSAINAGAPLSACLYTGPGKTRSEITEAIQAGIRFFSAEDVAELAMLERAAADANRSLKILLRVNAGQTPRNAGLPMMGVPSQFGIDEQEIITDASRFTRHEHLHIAGFHFYMASNILAVEDLAAHFIQALAHAQKLSRLLQITPEMLNLGGGFGHPFANNEPRPCLNGLNNLLEPAWENYCAETGSRPQLIFESGRYLVGACGQLIVSVASVKQSRGENFVVLNSGINHLGGMAGLRRIPAFIPVVNTTNNNTAEPVELTLCGPLCTPLDVLARKIKLPLPRAGDLLVIQNTGAYGLSGSLVAFLSHAMPVELVLHNNRVVHASRPVMNRQLLTITD